MYSCRLSALLPPTSIFDSATPGVFARIAKKSREPGRLASFSLSKCVVTSVDERSTTGDAPLTVTLSLTAPGLISALTVAVKPSPTWMPSRTMVAKPANSKVSVWSPVGTAEKR